MAVDKGVWILAEQRQGELEEVSLELLCAGRKIADELGEEICVLIVGNNVVGLADLLAGYGADKIYLLDSPLLAVYCGELYTEALCNFIIEQGPRMFLCAATPVGKNLAPRLAARLKTGLVSDCIILGIGEDGLLLQTKPTHGGKVYSTYICPTARPQMATIRPGVMEIKDQHAARRSEIIPVTPQLNRNEPRTRLKGFVKADPKTIGIDEAEIIVAGGRGVGSAENFRLLEELAESLGGTMAGSLVAVDEGWVSKKKLVGQTGLTVSPKLYISCGISGASHHMLGMKDSEVIIAINRDRHAPIFKVADVGIVGNLLEIVPAMTRKVKASIKSNTQMNLDRISHTFSNL